MQITISGHHLQVTDALRHHVESKLNSLSRYPITKLQVVLSVEKNRQKAEATLHMKGTDLFAEATHDDLYIAVGQLSDKLSRQVIKHKEKTTPGTHR